MDDFNRVMGGNGSASTAFGTLEASLNKIDDLDARAMWKREFSDFDAHNVRISIAFYNNSFLELIIAQVPWHAFMYALKKELECASLTQSLERLLKRIIDYNGSEYIAPKEFNNFLRAFGPLKQCLNNVRLCSWMPRCSFTDHF